MYEIKVEPAFRADYARIMKRHPRLKGEFKEAVVRAYEDRRGS